MKFLGITGLALAAFCLPLTASVSAQAEGRASVSTATELSAAPKKKTRRARAAYQPQIACTILGCQPVPRGCRPEPGRYWSGMTTGFDVIVCP